MILGMIPNTIVKYRKACRAATQEERRYAPQHPDDDIWVMIPRRWQFTRKYKSMEIDSNFTREPGITQRQTVVSSQRSWNLLEGSECAIAILTNSWNWIRWKMTTIYSSTSCRCRKFHETPADWKSCARCERQYLPRYRVPRGRRLSARPRETHRHLPALDAIRCFYIRRGIQQIQVPELVLLLSYRIEVHG